MLDNAFTAANKPEKVREDDEDSKEDPEEDPSKDREPEDDDDDDDTDDEDKEPTKDEEEEEEEHLALLISSIDLIVDLVPFVGTQKTCLDYDPPMSHPWRSAFAEHADIVPRGQYDFVDAVKAGQGLIHSPGHDTRTIARASDRAEDVGYVRALQTSIKRMMNSIKEAQFEVNY
ncbi:hypothetical protein Tco_0123633 [Tanacetum coccineum]